MSKLVTFALAIACASLTTNHASAVLVAGGDGTQNTTAPAGISGWNNVAIVNSSSAVYVGNGWMLTAFHVGAGTATFPNGNSYPALAGTNVRLTNPDSSPTDLLMFRLTSTPSGISPLSISDTSPTTGATVYMIGNGRNRLPDVYEWTIDPSTDPDTWTEKPSTAGPADATGNKYAAGNTRRWGSNTLESGVLQINAGFGVVHSIWADFDDLSGEGQVVDNDSGGAMFLADGTLAGILAARGTLNGQPSTTAIFSPSNRSYAADLSVYHDQIMTTIPEPGFILSGLGVAASLLCGRRRHD